MSVPAQNLLHMMDKLSKHKIHSKAPGLLHQYVLDLLRLDHPIIYEKIAKERDGYCLDYLPPGFDYIGVIAYHITGNYYMVKPV